jgi:hypothetical protein
MKKFNNFNAFTDGNGNVIKVAVQRYSFTSDKPKLESSLDIEIGGVYIVKPDNPRKLKHRDRIVTVRGFVLDDIGNPTEVSVKFHDNNATGKVDIADLAPCVN